ncbi:MAG: sulfatase-like hydrolase/transferase [Planctomycetes bacterium]|nr:sulfatase-like hydrolase/transferase [Planctomycetota bacterium]
MLSSGLALLLAAGVFLWSCQKHAAPVLGPEGGFRNLLIVSFDTTRADHLGCYGAKSGATPVLDELARRGVLFETCITPAPITLPAHSSLLTGLLPYEHGARNNGTHRLAADVPTLAERLKQQRLALRPGPGFRRLRRQPLQRCAHDRVCGGDPGRGHGLARQQVARPTGSGALVPVGAHLRPARGLQRAGALRYTLP